MAPYFLMFIIIEGIVPTLTDVGAGFTSASGFACLAPPRPA